MDWESLYCPNRDCRYYGIPFYQGLMVKNGSSHGQKQALCKACGSSVSMRYGTAYLGLEADPAIFETAVRALAEGNSLRATARIVQIDKDTACDWLDRAAQHCRPVSLPYTSGLQQAEEGVRTEPDRDVGIGLEQSAKPAQAVGEQTAIAPVFAVYEVAAT